MALPNVSLNITDGALGLSQSSVDRIMAIIGTSSSGTVDSIVALTSPQDAVSSLGYGPLPEAAAFHLQTAGGTVYAVRTATGTPGSVTAVASIPASATGGGVLTVTGTPYDSYNVRVLIVTSGDNGTATFKYSLDGGDTYSDTLTTGSSPYTYAISNTGISLVFTSGSGTDWVAGEYYYFTTKAPEISSGGVEDSLEALVADSREWRCVHIVGNATPYVTSTTTTTFGVCTTAKTEIEAAESSYRYTYAVVEARDIGQGLSTTETEDNWITSVGTGLASFESKRVSVVAGSAKLQCAISLPGRTYARRSVAWPILAQRLKLQRCDDSGYAAKTGSLPGVALLYHNEEAKPGMDTARFTTARTIIGMSGFYCTHMKMAASSSSDFRYVQYREVMDEACRLSRFALIQFLNAPMRIDPVTGYIDTRDAIAIEGFIKGVVAAGVGDQISSVDVGVYRTDNILSTQTLRATIRIKPKAYAKYISVDIGFVNPALTFEASQ